MKTTPYLRENNPAPPILTLPEEPQKTKEIAFWASPPQNFFWPAGAVPRGQKYGLHCFIGIPWDLPPARGGAGRIILIEAYLN